MPDIIEACGKHGVRAAVVLSAGFSEVDAQGAALEHVMLANAKNYGVRIIGPNCLGIVRTAIGLNATFFKGSIKSGNLAQLDRRGPQQGAKDHGRRSAGKQPQHAQIGCNAWL